MATKINPLEERATVTPHYEVFKRGKKDRFPFIWKHLKYFCNNNEIDSTSFEDIDKKIRSFNKKHLPLSSRDALTKIEIKGNSVIYLIENYLRGGPEHVGCNPYSWEKYKVKSKFRKEKK